MKLYLIRHGIAVERCETIPDWDRPLTIQGQVKTKAIAEQLQRLGLHFDRLLTSPLLRAQETAVIFHRHNLTHAVETWEGLSPDTPLQTWLHWYAAEQTLSLQSLALVGHEPDLSHWATQLIWGEADPASDRWESPLQLKKAGIIGLHLPDDVPALQLPGKAQLFWLTPPRLLR